MSHDAPGARARVLIVEDQPDHRCALALTLRLGGYEPVEASWGEDGLAALAALAGDPEPTGPVAGPVAVVLDVRLPGIDGVEVLGRIRGGMATRCLPVVLISAHATIPYLVQGDPRSRFLPKPFHPDQLLEQLAELLEDRAEQATMNATPSKLPTGGTTPAPRPRVLIVEDHDVLTHCLSLTLRMEGIEAVVPPSLDAEAVIAATRETNPDVVLLDLNLGGGRTGIPLVAPLVALGTRVMVLTGTADEAIQGAALAEGAHGIFLKNGSLEGLCRSIADLTAGQTVLRPSDRDSLVAQAALRADAEAKIGRLSNREREVLTALVEGQSAEVISTIQFVALGTIRSHIRAILRKLEVNSQLAAVAVARRAGFPPA